MAFHAYKSGTGQFCPSYSRATPLQADVVEYDTTGEYDTNTFTFTAATPGPRFFYANLLWLGVCDGSLMTPLFFLKRVGWQDYIEIAGTDLIAHEIPPTLHNQGMCLVRSVYMNEGDKIQCRPCIASGGGLNLTPAFNVQNTCNYFGGFSVT